MKRGKIKRRIVGRKKTEEGFRRRTNEKIYNIYRELDIDSEIISRKLQWLGHLE